MPSSTSSSSAAGDTSGARRALIALIGTFVAMIALGLLAWLATPLSPVSEGRYLAAVDDHLAMLEESKGEEGRIILIGGSGTAFSVSAEQLGRDLDRPVYNGGIQAGIGFRNLVDLYTQHLDPENDLIVLLPELELLARDRRYSQVWCDVVFLRKAVSDLARRPRCVPHMLHRTYQEVRHHISGSTEIDPVYRRSGFNEVGDLTAHLKMEPSPGDFSKYKMPDISEAKLNRFKNYVQERLIDEGFAVHYVPAPIPEALCTSHRERLASLIAQLSKLSQFADTADGIDRFCFAHDQFFDGAGHLAAEGRAVQTENVRRALAQVLAESRAN